MHKLPGRLIPYVIYIIPKYLALTLSIQKGASTRDKLYDTQSQPQPMAVI